MTRPCSSIFGPFFLILVVLALAPLGYGQTALVDIGLEYGPYPVGFRHSVISDSSRTYHKTYDFSTESIARPIPVSVWFPARTLTTPAEPLKVLDYFRILKQEEEWEHLPDDQLLNWFYYQNTPANQAHLLEKTQAFSGREMAKGSFPIIVYAPSYQASSIENFALCEYLASHGYLVIASPSRGTQTRWFSPKSEMEMETQARDLEFLIGQALKYPGADDTKIAAMGFSFGGLSGVLAQMRNDRIKAIVSLDGTERYQESVLKKSPFFDYGKLDVPYIHMAQKEIPEEVLQSDNINPELNTKFIVYDSLSKSEAYKLKFHHLTHSYFSTLGVLFEKRDPRQDKSDPQIMESYRWVSLYSRMFLDAYLKKDAAAKDFIQNTPHENGIAAGLISHTFKLPAAEPMSFEAFNELASRRDYENLDEIYQTALEKYPGLVIPENALNTLGLQLVFDPEKSEQGIKVLEFATERYPESANLFDSLAEAYLYMGDPAKALESFKKSLELNPKNTNAIHRIEELGG
ncbi:MAG: tetratricopeptide repeat protein [Robiginitalea sp.]|uniref:tetratricopeptide repeat protein n=1 Tax=Robiginitalea sp. TaxID=1902411 RepID=UPI003C765EC2